MLKQLIQLAAHYGINTRYIDMDGQVQPASEESLLAVLQALGAPLTGKADILPAWRETRQNYWQQIVEPVVVAWENRILTLDLHLPSASLGSQLNAVLTLEDSRQQTLAWQITDSEVVRTERIGRTAYVALRLYLPQRLPLGYHRLQFDLPGQTAETLVISAPLKAFNPPLINKNIWGVFLPLYALHTQQSWGAGNFSDLETLMGWVSGLGGQIAGTLPLLPSFFDTKYGPGPYMPASKLFWNEFYLDVTKVPELTRCPEAQSLLESANYHRNLDELRLSQNVDYKLQYSLKRQVLEKLADGFFSAPSPRLPEFQDYVNSNDYVEDYAAFRAAGEANGIDWYQWPRGMKNGKLKSSDYSETIKNYHLYFQWLAREQMTHLSEKARQNNIHLYLDFPVGVHPYSYDVWRERDSFATGVYGGAPPDPVFTSGQNWSFPPLHPLRIRYQGYRYLIDSLRHQLAHAGILRIDHMMGFHRLFWIPEGMECRQGVYVNYRAEELYAILALESCRSRSIIIGEDLGIVPPEVRPMMEQHGILRMFIGQYELITENEMGRVPSNSLAGLNTHDMFPFASFWQENDIAERRKIQLIDAGRAGKELEQRQSIKQAIIKLLGNPSGSEDFRQNPRAIFEAVTNYLASSPAFGYLVNLEDLWSETEPQNIPGTQRLQNWSRQARFSFEEFSRKPEVLDLLNQVNRDRQGPSRNSAV